VALKTEEQQAQAMIFRARDLLVRQRTQLINALRGHLAEYGVVAAQGIAHLGRLQEAVEDPQGGLPPLVRDIGRIYLGQIDGHSEKIAALERTLRTEAARGETTTRLQTMPGIGPIGAMAIEAFAPPMENFRRGRDFAAWLGLVPRQKSTGGKQILGKTSKRGQRDIRRLLIIGAMAVVRWATRNGAPEASWLARMLACKPRMVVAIALANKMARSVWAMLVKQENYRDPVATAA
jgi:transposase